MAVVSGGGGAGVAPTLPTGDGPVDGVEYRQVAAPSEVRIVVLQRGWVVVGRWHRDGDDVTITDAQVIRRWGTSTGLGELVNGPTSSTTLDPGGTIRTHVLGVVLTIDAAGWPL